MLCVKMWTSVLLGLFLLAFNCDARAVNISNTWTMPAEGLNVFYRFFRDKISWFEADAVCQFHHANLVTVDNSFQFDASRDLLRELEVNDIVWIGLMRPQSSERFMWSTSHALAPETGYWAESLPLMDAPLCAVIDPVRDYRWHALRCGGPETASFLCEMNVPSWAESCILKDMPSLTIQYMADTASIELIRDCGPEEGLIRQMCRGKQDREQIMRELVCKSERDQLKKPFNILANTHFKSLEMIKNVPTDNNEDNTIRESSATQATPTTMPTEKNPVQQLIETFNVEEIMQADNNQGRREEGFQHIPGEIPKPVKKAAKKVSPAAEKKEKLARKGTKPTEKEIPLEDMMMGDQPIEDVANEIDLPLPHIKKAFPQDLKHLHHEKKLASTTTAADVVATTTLQPTTMAAADVSSVKTTAAAVATVATLSHPIHPQQQRVAITTHHPEATPPHPHFKETNDNHFIPPMLLVKSHYQSPKSHEHHEASTHPEPTTVHVVTTTMAPPPVNQTHSPQPTTVANSELASVATTKIDTSSLGTTEEATTTTTTQPPLTTTTPSPSPAATEDIATSTKAVQTTSADTTTATQLHTMTTTITSTTTATPNEPTPMTTTTTTEPPLSTTTTTTTPHPQSEDVATSTSTSSSEENIFASNKDTYQPYKPNRRRSLTKPEARSYFKKVLG